MGFVIQLAAGKAEAGPRTGVLGPADNAAGGQLGAKTAIKIRGTNRARARRGRSRSWPAPRRLGPGAHYIRAAGRVRPRRPRRRTGTGDDEDQQQAGRPCDWSVANTAAVVVGRTTLDSASTRASGSRCRYSPERHVAGIPHSGAITTPVTASAAACGERCPHPRRVRPPRHRSRTMRAGRFLPSEEDPWLRLMTSRSWWRGLPPPRSRLWRPSGRRSRMSRGLSAGHARRRRNSGRRCAWTRIRTGSRRVGGSPAEVPRPGSPICAAGAGSLGRGGPRR